jgi:hypothetical protein
VKEFCDENKVEYHNLPWIEAQRQLIASMKATAMKARMSFRNNSPESLAMRKDIKGNTIFDALDASMRG